METWFVGASTVVTDFDALLPIIGECWHSFPLGMSESLQGWMYELVQIPPSSNVTYEMLVDAVPGWLVLPVGKVAKVHSSSKSVGWTVQNQSVV